MMTKYICVLRGINVGGKRKILMADLRSLFEALGFFNVMTYIQSGNVIFHSKKKQLSSKVENRIAEAILEKYGFDVPTIVRSTTEIENIYKSNPFLQKEDVEIEKLYLTFLKETPIRENLDHAKTFDFSPDRFVIDNDHAFIRFAKKLSDSKLTNAFFEKKLKVNATTRNWKTITKLYMLSRNDDSK